MGSLWIIAGYGALVGGLICGCLSLSRSLVIIRGQEVPDYASAVIYNPLDVTTGETVDAWEPKARADAVLAQAWRDAAGLRMAEDDTRLLRLDDGVLSRVNEAARDLGARSGMPAMAFVELMLG